MIFISNEYRIIEDEAETAEAGVGEYENRVLLVAVVLTELEG